MVRSALRAGIARGRVCLALCLLQHALFGCGEEAPAEQTSPPVDAGPPELELGYFYEVTYDPLLTGDDLPIFHALQGGVWTMPAVHFRGLVSPAHITASLVTEAGETLGEIDQRHTFNNAFEGWIEIKRLPIPAGHAPPNEDEPIEDLFDQTATLSMTVSDDFGHEASASVEVVLADRPIL
jgi:hypothetical protein